MMEDQELMSHNPSASYGAGPYGATELKLYHIATSESVRQGCLRVLDSCRSQKGISQLLGILTRKSQHAPEYAGLMFASRVIGIQAITGELIEINDGSVSPK